MASLPPWRRTLPVAQLVFFLFAIGFGCPYVGAVITEFRQSPNQEAIDFRPQFIDGAPSAWEQLALGANLPPSWVAVVVVAIAEQFLPVLQQSGRNSELAQHATQALLIPVFWYWLGSRLDRRTAGRRRSANSFRAALGALELIVWILAVAVASILALAAFSGHDTPMPILACLATAWLSVGALAIRRMRSGVA